MHMQKVQNTQLSGKPTPNKIRSNNDKQIKLYETDGAVRNLQYSYQRLMQNREGFTLK